MSQKPQKGEGPCIIVQPDSRIVFLFPSVCAQAEIGLFAERQKCENGARAVFAVTRESILRAAAAGIAVRPVIEALRRLSAKPVPGNVVRSVRGWFGRIRSVAVEKAVLLRCPDAETAASVAALDRENMTDSA